MNYFEFKQQLLIESFTKDEEFHRMRKEDLRCARAYKDAMEFEKILNNALKIKAPDNLKDSIILRQSTNHSVKKPYRHYAIAASFFECAKFCAIPWRFYPWHHRQFAFKNRLDS